MLFRSASSALSEVLAHMVILNKKDKIRSLKKLIVNGIQLKPEADPKRFVLDVGRTTELKTEPFSRSKTTRQERIPGKQLVANRKLLLCQRVATCARCHACRDRDQGRTKLLSLAHVRAKVSSGPLAVACVRPQPPPPPLAQAASEARMPSSTVAAARGDFASLCCGVIYSERSDSDAGPVV